MINTFWETWTLRQVSPNCLAVCGENRREKATDIAAGIVVRHRTVSVGLTIREGMLDASLLSPHSTLRKVKNGLMACPRRIRRFNKM